MANPRYQVSFPMGTGDKGKAVYDLLEEQQKRLRALLKTQSISEPDVLKIALWTLAKSKSVDIVIDASGQKSPAH